MFVNLLHFSLRNLYSFFGSTRWKSGLVWKSKETLLISFFGILLDFGALCIDVISNVCAYKWAEMHRCGCCLS